jgi:outer membrane lipase/esterase
MQTTHFKRSAAAALLTAFSLVSQAQDVLAVSPFTSLKVFGDSLSDSGNNAVLLGTGGGVPTSNFYIPSGAPYASGTYSNGPVWVNAFAAAEASLADAGPWLAGGGNYAFGGARTNTDGVGLPYSATTQLNTFLAGLGGTTLPSSGLYVIAVGGNDVRDVVQALGGGAPLSSISTAASAYALAVGNMVDALQAKGAQHIVVWDAPDVGKTPVALAAGFSGVGTSVAAAFNAALAVRLAGEAGVIPFDIFGVVGGIVANPGAYGLVNVTDACGAVVNACSASLGTSLFYDGIHPTAAGQAILATAMMSTVAAAVPEPSTWLMLVAGVAVLVVRRRRA